METYCYLAVGSAAQGALAPTEGGEGRGHIVAAACTSCLKLKYILHDTVLSFYMKFVTKKFITSASTKYKSKYERSWQISTG